MKILGRSEEGGGIIVELNYAESATLSKLQDALDGKDWSVRLTADIPRSTEMDKAFEAILNFTMMNFAVNHLVNEVERIKAIIKGREE